MNKYIITGGACTGKTTLIGKLKERGFAVVPEAARYVIRQEQEKEKTISGYKGIFPWNDMDKFQEKIIATQSQLENEINAEEIFLDRSVVDILAYSSKRKQQILDYLKKANYTKAFLLEPLPFYTQDEQRKETEEEARLAHNKSYDAYRNVGIEIIKVPDLGLEKRVHFVLEEINKN